MNRRWSRCFPTTLPAISPITRISANGLTTFNEHQWDLNWANPQVFLDIAEIMLFLANRGVDVLRLDAVAFMWKRMGTRCQSEPEVHMLLQALRAVCRIACPAVLHLEEAIVAPAEMLPYLGRGRHDGKEGNLAYHNSLMVQFWSALGTRDTRLMTHVMGRISRPADQRDLCTYIRCHDDIGWAVHDEDAAALHLSGPRIAPSVGFLRTAPFRQLCPWRAVPGKPGDGGQADFRHSSHRWAGLEKAIATGDVAEAERAVQRILMGHALIRRMGVASPLIYMGDEIALLNDYSYRDVPEHAHDSRWIQPPRMDWAVTETAMTGCPMPRASGWGCGTSSPAAAPRPRCTRASDPGGGVRIVASHGLPARGHRPEPCYACSTSPKAGRMCQSLGRGAQGASRMHDELSNHTVGDASRATSSCRPMRGCGWVKGGVRKATLGIGPCTEDRRATRTWVAPAAIAASKSPLMPIDNPASPFRAAMPASIAKCGAASSPSGGMHMSPATGRSIPRQLATNPSTSTRQDARLLRLLPRVDLNEKLRRSPRSCARRASFSASDGRSTVWIASNRSTATLALLVCNGPIML